MRSVFWAIHLYWVLFFRCKVCKSANSSCVETGLNGYSLFFPGNEEEFWTPVQDGLEAFALEYWVRPYEAVAGRAYTHLRYLSAADGAEVLAVVQQRTTLRVKYLGASQKVYEADGLWGRWLRVLMNRMGPEEPLKIRLQTYDNQDLPLEGGVVRADVAPAGEVEGDEGLVLPSGAFAVGGGALAGFLDDLFLWKKAGGWGAGDGTGNGEAWPPAEVRRPGVPHLVFGFDFDAIREESPQVFDRGGGGRWRGLLGRCHGGYAFGTGCAAGDGARPQRAPLAAPTTDAALQVVGGAALFRLRCPAGADGTVQYVEAPTHGQLLRYNSDTSSLLEVEEGATLSPSSWYAYAPNDDESCLSARGPHNATETCCDGLRLLSEGAECNVAARLCFMANTPPPAPAEGAECVVTVAALDEGEGAGAAVCAPLLADRAAVDADGDGLEVVLVGGVGTAPGLSLYQVTLSGDRGAAITANGTSLTDPRRRLWVEVEAGTAGAAANGTLLLVRFSDGHEVSAVGALAVAVLAASNADTATPWVLSASWLFLIALGVLGGAAALGWYLWYKGAGTPGGYKVLPPGWKLFWRLLHLGVRRVYSGSGARVRTTAGMSAESPNGLGTESGAAGGGGPRLPYDPTAHKLVAGVLRQHEEVTGGGGAAGLRAISILRDELIGLVLTEATGGGDDVSVAASMGASTVSALTTFQPSLLLGGAAAAPRRWSGRYRGAAVAVREVPARSAPGVARALRGALAQRVLHHPNVELLVGLCTEGGLFTVHETAERGALRDVLREMAQGPRPMSWHNPKWKMAVGIARGMLYLHSTYQYNESTGEHRSSIIHGDLNCENLLVTHQYGIKIQQFTQRDFSSLQNHTADIGPLHVAPELLRGEAVDEKADVFSFAVVLLELALPPAAHAAPHPAGATGAEKAFRRAYCLRTDLDAEGAPASKKRRKVSASGLSNAVVFKNLRPDLQPLVDGQPHRLIEEGACTKPSPPKPEGAEAAAAGGPTPRSLCQMIEMCWHPDPSFRPSFKQILRDLEEPVWHEVFVKLKENPPPVPGGSASGKELGKPPETCIPQQIQGEGMGTKHCIANTQLEPSGSPPLTEQLAVSTGGLRRGSWSRSLPHGVAEAPPQGEGQEATVAGAEVGTDAGEDGAAAGFPGQQQQGSVPLAPAPRQSAPWGSDTPGEGSDALSGNVEADKENFSHGVVRTGHTYLNAEEPSSSSKKNAQFPKKLSWPFRRKDFARQQGGPRQYQPPSHIMSVDEREEEDEDIVSVDHKPLPSAHPIQQQQDREPEPGQPADMATSGMGHHSDGHNKDRQTTGPPLEPLGQRPSSGFDHEGVDTKGTSTYQPLDHHWHQGVVNQNVGGEQDYDGSPGQQIAAAQRAGPVTGFALPAPTSYPDSPESYALAHEQPTHSQNKRWAVGGNYAAADVFGNPQHQHQQTDGGGGGGGLAGLGGTEGAEEGLVGELPLSPPNGSGLDINFIYKVRDRSILQGRGTNVGLMRFRDDEDSYSGGGGGGGHWIGMSARSHDNIHHHRAYRPPEAFRRGGEGPGPSEEGSGGAGHGHNGIAQNIENETTGT